MNKSIYALRISTDYNNNCTYLTLDDNDHLVEKIIPLKNIEKIVVKAGGAMPEIVRK